jgi:CheY-like chemotaxis protein
MNNKTILVIEDNELNMKLIRNLLQIGQYQVVEATNAETGIRLARDNHPDLILMDIQLPGMDGLNATKVIKRDDVLKHIPVVALTSYAMQGDEKIAMEAGCVAYITKPLDTRSFLKKISKFFNGDDAK